MHDAYRHCSSADVVRETKGVIEIVASVTSRGQVTIPARVRRHLGIKTPGKVAFVLSKDGTAIIKPGLTMLDLRATLPALPGASVDFDTEIAEAMDEAADRRMAKMRRQ